jgi:sodium-dependent dicarboxylate transporter 2/3/5
MTHADRPPGAPFATGSFPALLSPAEARFDRRRRTAGLLLGPALFGLVWLLPLPMPSSEAHRLAAIAALVVMWWVTEALPFGATALAGSGLAVLLGVASAQQVFEPYASPTIFLFLGSFMLGQAISQHQLDRRVVGALVGVPWARGHPGRLRVLVGLLTMLVSAWMSNAATVAMVLPLVAAVMTAILAEHGQTGRPFAVGSLLTVAYGSGIGGLVTPVGSPPNLITLGLLDRLGGVHLTFPVWIAWMLPLALAHAVLLFAAVQRLYPAAARVEVSRLVPAAAHETGGSGWTAGQRNAALAFGVAVTLWCLPGLVGSEAPLYRTLTTRLNEGAVAVLAATLLFVLPTDWRARRFTLDWAQAVRIDWGTILLFGGGLSLGQLLFETGLAEQIGRGLLALTGSRSVWTMTALAMAAGTLLTEVTSNTACASMLVPVVLSATRAAGLDPVLPAFGALLGISASYLLPISAPHNAIIYGTGLLPVTAMLRLGAVMKVGSFVVSLAGLRLLSAWLPGPGL